MANIKEIPAMNRSFSSFNNRFSKLTAGLIVISGLFFASQAQAQIVSTTTPVPPPVVTPKYGVTTWTSLQSAGIGEAKFSTVGSGKSDGSGAYGMTDELFNVVTDINYKADPNCGPTCGEQTILLSIKGIQKVGSGSVANMVSNNGSGPTSGSATASNGSAAMSLVSGGAMFVPLTTPVTPAVPAAATAAKKAPGK